MNWHDFWTSYIKQQRYCRECRRPLQVKQRGQGTHPVTGWYTYTIWRRCCAGKG